MIETTATNETERTMARRTLPKDTGERVSLQSRSTSQVRDRLEEAARRSGRSLSQEIEMRLEQSLLIQDVAAHALDLARQRSETVVEMLGGPETFSLLRDIASIIQFVEHDTDKPWHSSPEARALLLRSLEATLPVALRMERKPSMAHDDAMWRALEIAKYLPFKPKPKPVQPLPEGLRFMTDEELKDFFYLRDD